MLTRMLLLITTLMGGLGLLTGAWPSPFLSPQNAESGFVPQSFPLDADIVGSGIGAPELLEKALAKLDWKQVTWLRTKIRQTMSDPESNFVADGFLQRGPGHCAHLELDINTQGSKARLLVISDGTTVASVRETPNAKPNVTVHALPAIENPAIKHEFLRALNCDGPSASLKDILAHLRDGKLQTGLLGNRRVIQITGQFEADTTRAGGSIPARHCHVYLDAQTLWPCQIEWWGQDEHQRMKAIMRVEYADEQINRELPMSECAKLFSYQPTP